MYISILVHVFFLNLDGNCFYWAVDDQCNGEGHLSIRKKVIDQILEMSYLWDYIEGEDAFEWKERMKKEGEFADSIAIQAVANISGKKLTLLI